MNWNLLFCSIVAAMVIAAGAAWGLRHVSALGGLADNKNFAQLDSYDPDRAYYPDERWSRAVRPELLGWSGDRLAGARRFSKTLDTGAVVIVENGVVVDAWGELDRRYESRSMRKSFLSLLYGRPVLEGKIRLSATLKDLGIDDDPPLTAKERLATVADLLTSRSGVYHPANFETAAMRRDRPPRGSHQPGGFWFYNNWDFNALGSILEQAIGKSVFEAFREDIAGPLQLQDYDTKYERGSNSIHPAYLFRMAPLDLARIGLLCLRHGEWKGRQIIPPAWLAESTLAHVATGKRGFSAGYGYMWWVGDEGFAAYGSDGQRLYVMPQRNLVVVHVVNSEDQDADVNGRDVANLLAMILTAKKT